MPRFAANLTMLFTEYPVPERFDRAAAAGFEAVELLFPYQEDIDGIRAALDRNGLTQVLFNLPVGDFAAGERGYANDPRRTEEFREGVLRALEIAAKLGVRRINCLVGKHLSDVPAADQWSAVKANLALAAELAQAAGVMQVVEPLNPYDAPDFLLATPSQGFALVEEIGHPNLFLEYDVYHAQRTEGNLTETIRAKVDRIGHVQIADSPARNQPGTGEINYPFVFRALDEAGYGGWIGLEYKPLGGTEASLGWLREWGLWS
jgi:hydroxypyruvate isomerase